MTSTTTICLRHLQPLNQLLQKQAHTLHNMDNDNTNGQLVEAVAQIILGMDQAVSHDRIDSNTRTDV